MTVSVVVSVMAVLVAILVVAVLVGVFSFSTDDLIGHPTVCSFEDVNKKDFEFFCGCSTKGGRRKK